MAELHIRMVTSWTLGPIGSICIRFAVVPKVHCCNNLNWWAHQDSNLGPADYEGKPSRRHFKVFLEMAPNLLSRVSTSVQGFHGVA
jgi:hypothetical protein